MSMPSNKINLINKKVRSDYSYRSNNKNMNKDLILPMIAGILLGAMIMIFWQFNARLNNINSALVQLDQVSSQNTTTVNEVVNFLNQAGGAAETPAATE